LRDTGEFTDSPASGTNAQMQTRAARFGLVALLGDDRAAIE
jgi:hypothetical protein